MAVITLEQAILEGGLRTTHYFNGRLLVGEDLVRDRDAVRTLAGWLAEAVGSGVARGLEVGRLKAAASSVTVKPGLAIAADGLVLHLPGEVEVDLAQEVVPRSGAGASPPCAFRPSDEAPAGAEAYVAGEGVYVLTIGPARGTSVRLAATDSRCAFRPAGSIGLGAGQAAHEDVEGVLFRLHRLPVGPDVLLDRPRLRNAVAAACLGRSGGTDVQLAPLADPFGPQPEAARPLGPLSPPGLERCEVPLAVLHWNADSGGMTYVDNWSARRRLARPGHAAVPGPLVSDARAALAEARLLQFQEHVATLDSLSSSVITDHFRVLPPCGLIPLKSAAQQSAVTGVKPGEYLAEVATSGFFKGLVVHGPVFIDASQVEPLLRASLQHRPIELEAERFVRLYVVRENRSSDANRPYLIFASGRLPFAAQPRFDVSYCNYSNFTSWELE
jgi:hypothetical protein